MRVQSNSHSQRKAREIAWKRPQLFYFRVSASEWIIYCEADSKEKQWVKQIQPKNVFPTKNKLYWHRFELLGKLAYSCYSDSKPVFKTELCSLSFKRSLHANVSFFFCRSLHASCMKIQLLSASILLRAPTLEICRTLLQEATSLPVLYLAYLPETSSWRESCLI